ncbi:MAG: protein-ADP-ribose hydrolase [Muribaculaceae bacterium]|nr:protein-ADP-ribose hydrolase [Roseburia sp.]MCM1431326.1 protein-ADP-ribose hydrolase [Muribaculaceae bacterium]MCM1491768.1 protein-ADP-ribose hydrolase [Muribaculaceae bacterium]
MTQEERRLFLIHELLRERPEYRNTDIPVDTQGQKRLLRSLFNIRMPQSVSEEFLKVQDAYLRELGAEKGITALAELTPVQEDLYIWQGDITTLKCGAIVNAANSQMLGCFCPCHGCIDNAIHTYSGVQLRLACARLMQNQGHEEPAGGAKITPAYNLPCEYVLHTVGPIVRGRLTQRDEKLLASCYRSCLMLAEENGVDSIAFCCISTGEFHFPNERAAEIAVETVKEYKRVQKRMKVIFNVFKQIDYEIYRSLLG